MRIFTAIDIENQEALEKLEKVQGEVSYGFNKVKPEKMHLTLQFFQNINQEEVEKIKKGLKQAKLESFKMKVKGVGVFPSRKHVRVVWAGIESEKIFDLKEQVSNHSVPDSNDHEFHPHITLARVNGIDRTEKKYFRQKLEKLENREITEINVNKIKLFESIHNGKNTEYRVIEEEKL